MPVLVIVFVQEIIKACYHAHFIGVKYDTKGYRLQIWGHYQDISDPDT